MTDLYLDEQLELAADLIEERGHTTGGDGWPYPDDTTSQLCFEGGLMAALEIDTYFLSEARAAMMACPAYRAVRQYMVAHEMLGSNQQTYQWNDGSRFAGDSPRTADEVTSLLRTVAKEERVKRESAEVVEEAEALILECEEAWAA